ncbi:hypothetical protein EMIHUDRAFT_107607 [Emiliania huxleyi CCMP1516]|uniref:Uncharacterized protein n=2 Tax=Emiliania huxleyi TaxID=2903 RepID=A0A0D3I0B3_EMIH1|nr:hypothetical protein EMIHUDRAFT_107607 [Emiliania huxleyi CCMP1516]EOD04698.1 hypothetical protein EMIHUDRAFT_107607 [Emiliania huxleyi CCMP1516]|eukprot:XP_005757127.1 hypothetical protein EMIHUDRAFT_107607 [Emiliania huxleyi CCMP1516]
MSLPTGYYAFEWSGGTFEVQLRPGGEFWCPRFAAPATWQFSGGTLAIDWGKYGEYVLRLSGDALAGGARGNESDWRKMRFLRAFTPQEALVSASVWRLRSGDEEPLLVQFRADGRFVCPSRPGTFSYRLEGDSVLIEWDSLSNDRLQLDMAAKAMARRVGRPLSGLPGAASGPYFNLTPVVHYQAPAKAKLSWGMDVPEYCTPGAPASGASGGGGSNRD